jgi:hypothetical protein
MAPCPVCAEKLRLRLLASGRFSCPRCRAPLQSNALFALNLAGAISGSPAVLLSLVCENFMWPHVTFVAVFGALAGSLFVLLTHARRSRDYV